MKYSEGVLLILAQYYKTVLHAMYSLFLYFPLVLFVVTISILQPTRPKSPATHTSSRKIYYEIIVNYVIIRVFLQLHTKFINCSLFSKQYLFGYLIDKTFGLPHTSNSSKVHVNTRTSYFKCQNSALFHSYSCLCETKICKVKGSISS